MKKLFSNYVIILFIMFLFLGNKNILAQTDNAYPYCQPYSYGQCSYAYSGNIRSVTVGSFTNPTGCRDDNSQYTYYNNLSPITLLAGTATTYKVDAVHGDGSDVWLGSYGGVVSIWVDFNGNNNFDGNELVMTDIDFATARSTGVSFTTPTTSTIGKWRMRVRTSIGNSYKSSTYPCDYGTYGEIEDYDVIIQQPYCIPVFTYNCSSEDYINNFTFAGIKNNNSGCNGQANNYKFYSNITGQVEAGATYTLQIQSGTLYAQGHAVWIDYNNNRSFDDGGEKVFSTSNASTNLYTASVTIPPTTAAGNYFLRTRCAYNTPGTLITSCGSMVYGETEDYIINVKSSAQSDIIANPTFSYSYNIPYSQYQAASSLTTQNSVAVMGLTLRDGGGTDDYDGFGTNLTSISFLVSNPSIIRAAALFDGSTKIAETTGGGTLTFSGLSLSAADNGSKNFTLRVTYNSSNITDKTQNQFTVSNVTANIGGSQFAAINGGGTQSSIAGDANRINVIADRLQFVGFVGDASYEMLVPMAVNQSINFKACDTYGNIDKDYTAPVIVTNTKLNGGYSATNSLEGIASFKGLVFTTKGTGEFVVASSGSWVSNSTGFDISGKKLSDIIETPGFVYQQNIRYDLAYNQSNSVTSSSAALMGITIRDGGATGDIDTYPTSVNKLFVNIQSTISGSHLKSLAIFDGTTKIAEASVGISMNQTIIFSGFNYIIPDDQSRNLTIRGTFRAPMDDKIQLTLKVTIANVDLNSGGSAFPAFPYDNALPYQPQSSTSGNNNMINVLGDRLFFTQQPVSHLIGNTIQVAVQVRDALGSIERDPLSTPITLTNSLLNASPITSNVYSNDNMNQVVFSNLTFNAIGNNQTITASAPNLIQTTSSAFNISASNQSIIYADPDFAYSSNIEYKAAANQGNNVASQSVAVMGIVVNDGPIYAVDGDADNAPTILTGLTISATNSGNLNRAALYDGTTELQEVAVAGGQIVFSNLNVNVQDNSKRNLQLRLTYKSAVTDNLQNVFTVISATADGNHGSTFLNSDGSVPNNSPTYCDVNMPYNQYGYGMNITNVTFADMSNTTGAPASNLQTYFAAKTAHVSAGQSYNFAASTSSGYQVGLAAWIDFNRNGVFDANEKVYGSPGTATAVNPAPQFSSSVVIPNSAVNGTATMRVMLDYYTTGNQYSPCSNSYGYGEVEDYPVVISGGQPFIPGGQAKSSSDGDINRINVVADHLVIAQQPIDVELTNSSFMPQDVIIKAVDGLDNIDADYTEEISLHNDRLSNDPTSANAVAGVATFSNLSFALPGIDQHLIISSDSYSDMQSDVFQIWARKLVWLNGGSINASDNSLVQTWADDAGGDDNAVQTISSYRPTYRSGSSSYAINGNPVVMFSSSKGLGIAARDELTEGSEKSLFVVFHTGSSILTRQMLAEFGGIASGFNMYIASSKLYAGAWESSPWWINLTIGTNRTYLAQFVYNGSMLRLSVTDASNGSSSSTQSTTNNASLSASTYSNGIGQSYQQTRYHNGMFGGSNSADWFTNAIAEVITLNTTHIDGRNQIFNYLNNKYGFGASSQPLGKDGYAQPGLSDANTDNAFDVYPNPTNGIMNFNYSVPVEGKVRIVLQNILGETVGVIVPETIQQAGQYSVQFDAGSLSSGIYRATLITATGTITIPTAIQR